MTEGDPTPHQPCLFLVWRGYAILERQHLWLISGSPPVNI